MTAFKRFLVCLVTATLLFGGHFRAWLDPEVRYVKFFQHADIWPLVAAVVLLALVFWLVGALILFRAGPRRKKLVEVSYFVLLVQGLLVSIRPPPDERSVALPLVTGFVWCAAILLLFADWRKPAVQLGRKAANLALILSPLPLILVWSLLRCPSMPAQCAGEYWDQKPRSSESTGAPIIVVIFDQWCYQRTFPDGTIPEFLPNLNRLARTATFYSNARSGGPATIFSMPRLLFQTTNGLAPNGNQIIAPAGESLLDRAPPGYQKAVFGFYLPYYSMLRSKVDLCRTYPLEPAGTSFAGKIGCHFIDFLIFWQDPWIESLRNRWYVPGPDKPSWLFGPYWYELGRKIVSGSKKALETMPPNTIAFFHFPFPHTPVVVNPDGSRREIRREEMDDPAIYKLNLIHVDQTLGLLMEALKARRLWDETLFIVSSDHNWRQDLVARADAKLEALHVPLFIKHPGQHSAELNTNLFLMTKVSAEFPKAAPQR